MAVKYIRKYKYNLDNMEEDLGGFPSQEQILRLVENYPSYNLPHRKALLEDIMDGVEPVLMAENKIEAKGLVSITKQGKGGHTRWVVSKLLRFTIRLLYLQHRLDEGLTRRKANARIFKALAPRLFKDEKKYESAKRLLRQHTFGALADSSTSPS